MALATEGLKNISVQAGMLELNDDNMVADNGELKMSWISPQNLEVERGDLMFTITATAEVNGELGNLLIIENDSPLRSEAYDSNLKVSDIKMNVRNNEVVSSFEVYQNEPNPFGDQTTIAFDLPKSDVVELNIVDITGKRVYKSSATMQKGQNTFVVEAAHLGETGIYYYTITSGHFTQTKKMIFVK